MKLLKTVLFIFKTEAVVPAVEVHLLQECKALLILKYWKIAKGSLFWGMCDFHPSCYLVCEITFFVDSHS